MGKDNIYARPVNKPEPFTFNESVVRVFDDMITRSVPHYRELIRLQSRMVADGYQPDTCIYDLGCSNGNLEQLICEHLDAQAFRIVAVDSSAPMIEAFSGRFRSSPWAGSITPVCDDIRRVRLQRPSVVIVNFTLQFISIDDRRTLIDKIYQALCPFGILLVSEKTVHPNPAIARMQQDFYCAFKKENGYTDLEIRQKRDALENVLIPETEEAHLDRFRQAGFRRIDVWHKWFNFISVFCQKEGDF